MLRQLSKLLLIFLGPLITLNSCVHTNGQGQLVDPEFADYWYTGQAEITSYDLQQARYGEMHLGTAALVFVTEDFSKSKQVKLDHASAKPEDAVKVLKLNFTKKFLTGIYPYSMMTSVFTPVDQGRFPGSQKVTNSSQEWCGHTFTQVNRKSNGYDVQWNSYFETEGDGEKRMKIAHLEDELWNLIRLDPQRLPLGNIDIIPGTMYERLGHTGFDVLSANATLTEGKDGSMLYILSYKNPDRTLRISFKKSFPFEIEGWEETYRDGYGSEASRLTTIAIRKSRTKLDYWNHNQPDDLPLREKLGL